MRNVKIMEVDHKPEVKDYISEMNRFLFFFSKQEAYKNFLTEETTATFMDTGEGAGVSFQMGAK